MESNKKDTLAMMSMRIYFLKYTVKYLHRDGVSSLALLKYYD